MDFRMAVRERYAATAVVISSGHVFLPLKRSRHSRAPRSRIAVHHRFKISPIDAIRPLIYENECLGRAGRATRIVQLRKLGVKCKGGSGFRGVLRVFAKSSTEPIHRVRTNPGNGHIVIIQNHGAVPGAFVYVGVLIVLPHGPQRDVRRLIVIVSIARGEIQFRPGPCVSIPFIGLGPPGHRLAVWGSANAIVTGTHDPIGIVLGIHSPGQGQLAAVVHALYSLGLGFGAREGGQKQARENRNDGDDNQQLNQSEG